jgi:ZIP family zinc transporter
MVPRGTSRCLAVLWAVFSSVPQPLMAIPAYMFVSVFRPVVPIGLGFAAGAMIAMVLVEMIPEAVEHASRRDAAVVAVLASVVPIAFNSFLRENL